METPWGQSQTVTNVAEGIVFVSTAGHGGYLLSPERQAQVAPALRRRDRWYEEDCEWAVVCVTFPEFFPEEARQIAPGYVERWGLSKIREGASS